MFTNPFVPQSLLFVFKIGNQYGYLLKSNTQVHREVIQFFKNERNGILTQQNSQTTTRQTTSTTNQQQIDQQ